MSSKKEAPAKAPLGTIPRENSVITITEEQYNQLMFTARLFFEYSNMMKKALIACTDEITAKRLEDGDLKYFYENDLVDTIQEDGTKVKNIRKDFWEENSTHTS